MAWVYLSFAIVFEVAGTVCLKFSEGYSKLMPTLGMVIFYAISFWLISMSLKLKMEIGTAYGVWAGAGTALVAVVGFYYFKDSVTTLKVISLGFIIVGVMGLNFSGLKH